MSPISSTGMPAPAGARCPTVGELMRPPVTTVELGAHLAAAAYLMKRSGDSALVVTTNGDSFTPLGLITDFDISQAVADGRDLDRVRISDVLSEPTVDVALGTPVVEALRIMLERRIHHLLVLNKGVLVGIVDMTDLCRGLMAVPTPRDSDAAAQRTAPSTAPNT